MKLIKLTLEYGTSSARTSLDATKSVIDFPNNTNLDTLITIARGMTNQYHNWCASTLDAEKSAKGRFMIVGKNDALSLLWITSSYTTTDGITSTYSIDNSLLNC